LFDCLACDEDAAPGLAYSGVPDLASYDWIVVATSGGKDSQTALRLVVEAAKAAGVISRVVAVHADLGRVEWPGTKELAATQAAVYGVPFHVLKATGGDLLDRVEARGMWPDAARRWCTSDLKRGPCRTLFTRLAAQWRDGGGEGRCRILSCMGMRAEESPARRKLPAYSYDASASNKTRRHVDVWLPIHTWTAEAVWRDIRASGVPHHRAYDLGMPRLSCSLCVLASRSALVRAAQLRPELAAEYLRVEVRIGHRFRKDLSMGEIVARSASGAVEVVDGWVA
jgi:3'-phosphoadenosine 5'-phosphosulfate sulfotransferase (PAPS reductase)/FAD synthetase